MSEHYQQPTKSVPNLEPEVASQYAIPTPHFHVGPRGPEEQSQYANPRPVGTKVEELVFDGPTLAQWVANGYDLHRYPGESAFMRKPRYPGESEFPRKRIVVAEHERIVVAEHEPITHSSGAATTGHGVTLGELIDGE